MFDDSIWYYFFSKGDTSEGDSSGGDSSGGDSSGGDSSGGDSSGGDNSGTDSSGGDSKECIDIWKPRRCRQIWGRRYWEKRSKCKQWWAIAHCAKTCEKCDEFKKCKDFSPRCAGILKEGRCNQVNYCAKTCGQCKWFLWLRI